MPHKKRSPAKTLDELIQLYNLYKNFPDDSITINRFAEAVLPHVKKQVRIAAHLGSTLNEFDREDLVQTTMALLFVKKYFLGNRNLSEARTPQLIARAIRKTIRVAVRFCLGEHLRSCAPQIQRITIDSDTEECLFSESNSPESNVAYSSLKSYVHKVVDNMTISTIRKRMLLAHVMQHKTAGAVAKEFRKPPTSVRRTLAADLRKLCVAVECELKASNLNISSNQGKYISTSR